MTDDEILTDLEHFNDTIVQFKVAVDGKDLERMPIIFNELLTILKHIIETYRLVDSIDILEYAAKLIHLLQDLHPTESVNYNPEIFSQAIDQLALCLTAGITNRFILPSLSNTDRTDLNNINNINTANNESDALFDILIKRSDGVEIAHEHARYLSKYMFSLIHIVQERSAEELEHSERVAKLTNNCSLTSFLTTYKFLPGVNLMLKTLNKDITNSSRVQSTWMLLRTHEFVGKLDTCRIQHDNIRKAVKIQWDKSLKKYQQAIEDARSNSKPITQIPMSPMPTSDSAVHSTNSPIGTHSHLQRAVSSPPNPYMSSIVPSSTSSIDIHLENLSNDLELKRKELEITKHETLAILNKLIYNTENVIIESLNRYFRLTDSLTTMPTAYIPRSKGDLTSLYSAYIQSLPPCINQQPNISTPDNSVRRIPTIIKLSCQSIEKLEGHKIKGIYRLSGVKSKVDHLCRQFVQGIELNENDLTNNYSAIVLANAIKKYLRELSVPLLLIVESSHSMTTVQNELIQIGKEIYSSASILSQISSRINEHLHRIIEEKLSIYSREALVYLLKHLNLVSLNEQENQMSAANLGIVFGPTLFKHQQHTNDDTTLSTLLEAPYQAKLVEYLIINVHVLFGSDD